MRTQHKPDLPPALADLREQFRSAAAREAGRRGSRRPKLLFAATLGLLAMAGAAVAGGVLNEDGEPLRPEPQPGRVGAAPGVVTSSAVPDPDGGLPWALRVFSNDRGEDCVTVGRLRDGVLGFLRRESFRPLPDDAPGACGSLSAAPLLAAVQHRAHPPRTIVYGLSRERDDVVISLDGRSTTVPVGALGTYLHVRDGLFGRREASVSAHIDGRRVVERLR